MWTRALSNGLTLVAERMDWVESAAFAFVVPSGCVCDPDGKLGLANFTCEMAQRGSGARDNRQFVMDLDRLGADRHSSVSQAHTSYSAAMLADNLYPALSMYADLVRRPYFSDDELEESRLVCLQEIRSLEDDLAQKVMQRLRYRTYPEPWGRLSSGSGAGIEAITRDDVLQFHQQHYAPQNAILSVAGKFDWAELVDQVESLLGDWQAPSSTPTTADRSAIRYEHLQHESNQMQIGIAYETVPYRDPDYFQARGAVGILSGGMSSRLFTEVREKRGLCYTVYASYHSLRDEARILSYSATSTDRAQETLDVMLAEIARLADGIHESELRRLKAGIKSALIMQQESSAARCSAMAGDWYHLGRLRNIQEINEAIDGLSCESINRFLAEHPPGDFCVVTLGERPLEAPVAIS